MGLLREDDRKYLTSEFSKHIKNPVKIIHFTSDSNDCMYCKETMEILKEVEELHDLITLYIYDFDTDRDIAQKYGIEMFPATVIEGEKDYGIKFYGIPAGYEFSSLVEDIMDVGKGKPELKEETINAVKDINKPVHLKVFVTTTCPYCPTAVRIAHKFAMVNENIKGDMIEANEFPELSQRYNVYAVPRVVINEDRYFEGALPENQFLNEILEALKEE